MMAFNEKCRLPGFVQPKNQRTLVEASVRGRLDCPVVDVSTCDDVDAGSATWSGVGQSGEASRNAVARSRAATRQWLAPFTPQHGTTHRARKSPFDNRPCSLFYLRPSSSRKLAWPRQAILTSQTDQGGTHHTDAEKETSQNIPQMSNAWFLAPYPPEISHYPTSLRIYIRPPAACPTSPSSESPHASSTRPQTASASARPGGP